MKIFDTNCCRPKSWSWRSSLLICFLRQKGREQHFSTCRQPWRELQPWSWSSHLSLQLCPLSLLGLPLFHQHLLFSQFEPPLLILLTQPDSSVSPHSLHSDNSFPFHSNIPLILVVPSSYCCCCCSCFRDLCLD